MGNEYGEAVHGERIVDGNAAVLTVIKLYDSGLFDTDEEANERTLQDDERLHITDILITVETAGDVSLLADAAAEGQYIVQAAMAATSIMDRHLRTPYVCPMGVTPKFSGPGTNRSSCIIEGFITK